MSLVCDSVPVAWQFHVRLPEYRGGAWESSLFLPFFTWGMGIQSSRISHLLESQSLVFPYSRGHFFSHYCLHTWSRWLPDQHSQAPLPNLQKSTIILHISACPCQCNPTLCWDYVCPLSAHAHVHTYIHTRTHTHTHTLPPTSSQYRDIKSSLKMKSIIHSNNHPTTPLPLR